MPNGCAVYLIFIKGEIVINRNIIIDTSVLLDAPSVLDYKDSLCTWNLILSESILKEIDRMKTRSDVVGFNSREVSRKLEAVLRDSRFEIVYVPQSLHPGLSTDDEIVILAAEFNARVLSNDLNVRLKAKLKGIEAYPYYGPQSSKWTNGWYSDVPPNDILVNEYVVHDGKTASKWDGECLSSFDNSFPLKTIQFGDLKAKDVYQECAINSLKNEQFTVLTGPAGSGKSYLSLLYAFHLVEKEQRSLCIFTNPVKVRHSEDLGSYPGSRTEKLLQNGIGSMLISKIGSITEVEYLINEGVIKLFPISDIRGIELGDQDILYIPEAQNLSVDLAKLAIQRAQTHTKIILEGDFRNGGQIDKLEFEMINGLARVVSIFRGSDLFSHVHLPNIYRSEVAKIAERL